MCNLIAKNPAIIPHCQFAGYSEERDCKALLFDVFTQPQFIGVL